MLSPDRHDGINNDLAAILKRIEVIRKADRYELSALLDRRHVKMPRLAVVAGKLSRNPHEPAATQEFSERPFGVAPTMRIFAISTAAFVPPAKESGISMHLLIGEMALGRAQKLSRMELQIGHDDIQ